MGGKDRGERLSAPCHIHQITPHLLPIRLHLRYILFRRNMSGRELHQGAGVVKRLRWLSTNNEKDEKEGCRSNQNSKKRAHST